jgi:hypothetical protein
MADQPRDGDTYSFVVGFAEVVHTLALGIPHPETPTGARGVGEVQAVQAPAERTS